MAEKKSKDKGTEKKPAAAPKKAARKAPVKAASKAVPPETPKKKAAAKKAAPIAKTKAKAEEKVAPAPAPPAKKSVKKAATKAAVKKIAKAASAKEAAEPKKSGVKKRVAKVIAIAAKAVVKTVAKTVAGKSAKPAGKTAVMATKKAAPKAPKWQTAVKEDTQAAAVVTPTATLPSSASAPRTVSAARKGTGTRPAAPQPAPVQPVLEDAATASETSRMVLMLRDPKWLCVYWELDPADAARHRVGALVGAPLLIVRMHQTDLTARMMDFTVLGRARTWYIPIDVQAGSWRAELGYIGSRGKFVTIVASNELMLQPEPVRPAAEKSWVREAPIAAPTKKIDAPRGPSAGATREPATLEPEPEVAGWAAPRVTEEGEQDVYLPSLSEFPGSSEQLAGGWPSKAKVGGASEWIGALIPPGASEMMQPGPAGEAALRKPAARGFWLRVATELILYGATEPDATVTVQGLPVQLRADGTFSLRFALPDGVQELPVHAASADGIDERTITPVVKKETF